MKANLKIKQPSTPIAIGQVFGQLLIESESSKPYYWNVICTRCGTHKEVRGDNLRSGRTVSCGQHRTKHGATAGGVRTPTYESWHAMHARCRDVTDKDYGGRSITVCKAWADFSVFLQDMRERPEGKTLDRIDVLQGYSPNNCRWADASQQRDNRTDTKYLVYESSYSRYKNTPREWAAYLREQTGKPWNTKTLKAFLQFLTLTQILGAISDCSRTPDELVEEGQRRLHERARRSFGLQPGPNPNHVPDEADAAIAEWLGADEFASPEPILPKHLTKDEVACMEEMQRFTIY